MGDREELAQRQRAESQSEDPGRHREGISNVCVDTAKSVAGAQVSQHVHRVIDRQAERDAAEDAGPE